MRAAQDALWPENVDAWACFQALATRFLWDGQAIGSVWAVLTDGQSVDERIDGLERLAIIYDVLYPTPPERTED